MSGAREERVVLYKPSLGKVLPFHAINPIPKLYFPKNLYKSQRSFISGRVDLAESKKQGYSVRDKSSSRGSHLCVEFKSLLLKSYMCNISKL